MIALASALGARVVAHPDNAADGATTIEDRGAGAPASADVTRTALIPDNDRAGVIDPPDLLMTVCAVAASSGVQLLLVDGRTVYLDLADRAPDALAALATPRRRSAPMAT